MSDPRVSTFWFGRSSQVPSMVSNATPSSSTPPSASSRVARLLSCITLGASEDSHDVRTESKAEAITSAEANIAATEARLVELGEALQNAAAAQDYAELQRLTDEYGAAEHRLEQLFKEWETLTHEPAGDYRADG